jgi:hypothetical protein
MDDLIATLRLKGRVEVDEHLIEYAGEWHRLKAGDQYLGKHGDNKPELLTCRRLEVQRRQTGRVSGKVFPKERKKRLYNLEEVIRVIIRTNPNWDPSKKEQKDDDRPIDSIAGPAVDGEADEVRSGGAEAVRDDDRSPALADDRGGQREDSPRPRADSRTDAGKRPIPVPGDPRQRAGRTDYTAAARKPD